MRYWFTSDTHFAHANIIKYCSRTEFMTKEDKLISASREGVLSLVKQLVSKGADIHVDNDWALRCASHNGQLEVVKYLVEAGANIHAYNDYALRWASENGHLEVVAYLKLIVRKEKIKKILTYV